ncbi:MAG: GTPase ObgE [Candidatus Caenarcaniphilales bacterium]|nr:GTPase ObgE [Candidatus Caenarcaniphilales bacterium]
MHKFIDIAEITVSSGAGGDGAVAWLREKFKPWGGPAGGDGGRGGSVYLRANPNLHSLYDFTQKSAYKASPGEKGGSKNCTGKDGKDLYIDVPVGTIARIILPEGEAKVLGDLDQPGDTLLVLKGGRGGAGNQHFATSRHQAPHFAKPGEPGLTCCLQLELKLIAHIGLIGLPNVGKSSLIRALTASKAKVGDYPFTTIDPNLGSYRLEEGLSLTMADIPGLVQGASKGTGLGFQFLRHIERTALIMHVLDISVGDLEKVIQDYQVVRAELALFNPEILKKKCILVLNKIDLCNLEHIHVVKNAMSSFATEGKPYFEEVIALSTLTEEGIADMRKIIQGLYDRFDLISLKHFKSEICDPAQTLQRDGFKIVSDPDRHFYKVESSHLEGLVRVTNFHDPESVNHLYQQLEKAELLTALKNCGIMTGDTVLIGKRQLIWTDLAEQKLI